MTDINNPDPGADAAAAEAFEDGEVTYLEAYAMHLLSRRTEGVVAYEERPGVIALYCERDDEEPCRIGTFYGIADLNMAAMGFRLGQMPSA